MSIVFMLTALFNKPSDIMDNTGILGFLECAFWENQFFLWTLSVSSTYNIVTMTVERSAVLVTQINHISPRLDLVRASSRLVLVNTI